MAQVDRSKTLTVTWYDGRHGYLSKEVSLDSYPEMTQDQLRTFAADILKQALMEDLEWNYSVTQTETTEYEP